MQPLLQRTFQTDLYGSVRPQAVPKGEGSGWVGLPGGGYGFFPSKGLPPKIFPQRSAIAFAYGK